MRVVTVVEGVCVTLDPDFDFIAIASDFLTERGYREESIRQVFTDARDDVERAARASIQIPPKLDATLNRIERDDFFVRAGIEDSEDVIEGLAKRLIAGMVLAAGVISTTILYVFASLPETGVSAGFTVLLGLWILFSFRRRKGIRAAPRFTRQYIDQRQRHREKGE
jgi:predicted unusual protein kinase regulating ubiquinone biosynthesis (AarF/ABC1/UbiB family)